MLLMAGEAIPFLHEIAANRLIRVSAATHASTFDPELIAARRWYHTIELPEGVVTPGKYDLRGALRRVPLPASLAGRRCLDIGTHDGFWAFAMERRGAEEVVAIDLDDPDAYDWPRPVPALTDEVRTANAERLESFRIAHAALGSSVQRRSLSVYDLSPEALGRFDFAVIGTLLLHLRDPSRALSAIAGVLDGELLVNDVISLSLTLLRPRTPAAKLMGVPGLPFWWSPNLAGLRRLVISAGFEIVRSGRPYLVANGTGSEAWNVARRHVLASVARQALLRVGTPHAWVLARPRLRLPTR